MKDRFGREVDYLRVSVTDRCNLRCIYCLPEEGVPLKSHQDILSYEEMERVLRAAAGLGIRKIRITGGEPLVRKGLLDFLGRVAAIPGIHDLALTTNGVLLAEYADGLKNRGVSRVNLSLDSLNRERFARITRWGKLDQVLEGLERALELGFSPVKINTVILRGINEREIPDFIHLAREYPVHVRFIELMPLGGNAPWEEGRFMPAAEMRELAGPLGDPLMEGEMVGNGPARYYRLKRGRGTVGFIAPLTEHFCSFCNRLRLTADGKANPCLAAATEIDLKSALRAEGGKRDLEGVLREAILAKPDKHDLQAAPAPGRKMSALGG